jgi:hypothetical protein
VPPAPTSQSRSTPWLPIGIAAIVLVAVVAAFLTLGSDGGSPTHASSGASPALTDPSTGEADPSATTADAGGAATGATFACSEVDPASWSPAQTSADLAEEVRLGSAPGPDGKPLGRADLGDEYPTPDVFLAESNVPDVDARRQVMEAAGYHDGLEYHWDDATAPHEVQVLAFRDDEAAKTYMEARLPNVCSLRGTDAMTPLGDEGFAFIDGMGAIHGEFILGGNQVSLVFCGCSTGVGVDDMVAWYQHWIEGYSSGETTDPSSTKSTQAS